MFDEILKYLQERAKQKLPQYDFSDNSILTKIFLYPTAFLIEEIYNLSKADNFINDADFVSSLASIYQIPVTNIQYNPGEIVLVVEPDTAISIPAGTEVIQISNPSKTGIIIEDLILAADEVNSLLVNNIPIIIKFVGNLDLNEAVALSVNQPNVTSAFVKTISTVIPSTNLTNVISNIMSRRLFLSGLTTNAGILNYLANFNPEIIPSLSHENLSVIFDLSKSKKIQKFCLASIENNSIKLTSFCFDLSESNIISIGAVNIDY